MIPIWLKSYFNKTRTISTKILGVHFQQQLNWDDHITELSKTCSQLFLHYKKWKELLLLT